MVWMLAWVTLARPWCVMISRGSCVSRLLIAARDMHSCPRLAAPWAPVAGALWRDTAPPGHLTGSSRLKLNPQQEGSSAPGGAGSPAGRPSCGAVARARLRQSGRPARGAPLGQRGRQPPEPRRGAGAAPCPLTPVGAAAGSVGRGAAGPGEAAPPPPGAPGGASPPSRPPSPGSPSAPRQRRLPAPPAPLGEGGGAPSYRRWEQSK